MCIRDRENEDAREQLDAERGPDCGINSNQPETTKFTNESTQSHQNHAKSLDKETLLRCIKQLILNQRQQNKCQMPAGIPYASLSTPEQVASHDLN